MDVVRKLKETTVLFYELLTAQAPASLLKALGRNALRFLCGPTKIRFASCGRLLIELNWTPRNNFDPVLRAPRCVDTIPPGTKIVLITQLCLNW